LLTGFGKYVLYRAAPDPAAWSAAARIGVVVAAALVWAVPLLLLCLVNSWRARPELRPDPASKMRVQSGNSGPGFLSLFSFLPSSILAAVCYWILVQLIPPLVISFVVPITDRYLFLPSVGVCLLLPQLVFSLSQGFRKAQWLAWPLLALVAVVWAAQTWSYVEEWRDPRSVWYGAHLKTKNSQVAQFLGEVYQGVGDRMNDFVKSKVALQTTNETIFAQAVIGDSARVQRLQSEWLNATSSRTNSIAYRDELWRFAWHQYQNSAERRGTLSAPNLFMNRGRLLVGEGKYERAIPEFKTALAFAQTSSYDVVRQESVVHALRGIGVAYWSLRNYREARDWFLKAQDVQKKSARAWIPTLDDEVKRVTVLAAAQP
jgi:hypothetical protein